MANFFLILKSLHPKGQVDIRLNTTVTSVHWGSSSRVRIVINNERLMEADHVILTVSLGVLKSGVAGGLFSPPLPARKQEAVDAIGFGLMNKIFLR